MVINKCYYSFFFIDSKENNTIRPNSYIQSKEYYLKNHQSMLSVDRDVAFVSKLINNFTIFLNRKCLFIAIKFMMHCDALIF